MAIAFHMAFPVRDLNGTRSFSRSFYGGLLGRATGRHAPTWQGFDFFGHQLSAHLQDPSANILDLKGFRDLATVFETETGRAR